MKFFLRLFFIHAFIIGNAIGAPLSEEITQGIGEICKQFTDNYIAKYPTGDEEISGVRASPSGRLQALQQIKEGRLPIDPDADAKTNELLRGLQTLHVVSPSMIDSLMKRAITTRTCLLTEELNNFKIAIQKENPKAEELEQPLVSFCTNIEDRAEFFQHIFTFLWKFPDTDDQLKALVCTKYVLRGADHGGIKDVTIPYILISGPYIPDPSPFFLKDPRDYDIPRRFSTWAHKNIKHDDCESRSRIEQILKSRDSVTDTSEEPMFCVLDRSKELLKNFLSTAHLPS